MLTFRKSPSVLDQTMHSATSEHSVSGITQHQFRDDGAFGAKIQQAELDYLTSSKPL